MNVPVSVDTGARERLADVLTRVLEWPLPQGTVETYSLPPWLVNEARAALAAGGVPPDAGELVRVDRRGYSGSIHAARREGDDLRTLCGKRVGGHWHVSPSPFNASEIECKGCVKALAAGVGVPPDAEEVEYVLREAQANIAELADDLKGFYVPDKDWPAHINKAAEVVAEIDDLLAGVGEARPEEAAG